MKELIAEINRKISGLGIDCKDKLELLAMIVELGYRAEIAEKKDEIRPRQGA